MTVPTALTSLASTSPPSPDEIIPIISGVATFGATLALSTFVQKLCGVSTATKFVPSINGFITVCVASLATEHATIFTHQYRQNPKPFHDNIMNPSRLLATASSRRQNNDDVLTIGPLPYNTNKSNNNNNTIKIPMHELRVCLMGLLAFKALGGRFWAIAPSSYTHLGSFSRWSIPCTEKYASKTQREMIEKMGRKWGCHTCGSRMLSSKKTAGAARFVGDHMPPKSVAEQMNKAWYRRLNIVPKVQFRFYPQCVNCSNTQGSILSKATNALSSSWSSSSSSSSKSPIIHLFSKSGRNASILKDAGGGSAISHFHGGRFRINHLTGGVLAGTIVLGNPTKKEVRHGNAERFKSYQHLVQNKIRQCINVLHHRPK